MHCPSRLLLRSVASSVLLMVARPAVAGTWTGLGSDGNWGTPANWAGSVAPASPEALVFSGTTRLSNTNNFAVNTRFDGITFPSGAGAFSLAGNDIDLGGSLSSQSANTQTLGLGLRLLQDTVIEVGNQNLTINAVISEDASPRGITKTGTAILNLRRANTYTGETTLRQGTLSLDFNGTGAPTSQMVASGNALRVGGGAHNLALNITGKNNTASVQTFGSTVFERGRLSLPVVRTGTGSMTLNLGTLSRQTGACLGVAFPASGAITVDAGTALQGGILGGWAFVGTDWVTHSAGTLAVYTGYTDLTGVDPVLPNSAAANVTFGATSSGTVGAGSGTTDINTLRFTDTANRTVDLGVGNTLRLGTVGGIWRTTTSLGQMLTFQNGALTAGGAPNSAGELVIHAGGTTASTTSRSNIAMRVYSSIADNGSGSVALTKTGPQIVELRGSASYSGPTTVLQGLLRVFDPSHLGTNAVYIVSELGLSNADHGTISLGGNGTYAQNFFLAGVGPTTAYGTVTYSNGALYFQGTGATVSGTITLLADSRIGTDISGAGVITGRITGNAALEFFATGYPNENCSLTVSNPANDWTGTTTININGTSGRTRTLKLGASEVIPHGPVAGNIVFQNGNSSSGAYIVLALNGYDETINGLRSSGGNAGAGNRVVRNGKASSASLLTVGDNDGGGTFFGTLENSSGTLAVRKIGAGKQVFSGACTYSGTTTVDGGELEVSGSMTTNNLVTANAGGTFAFTGTGVLGRAVTVNGGTFRYSSTNAVGYAGALTFTSGRLAGTNWWNNLSGLTINTGRAIAPGDGVGLASVGSQFWSNGGAYEFEITNAVGTAGTAWDLVAVSGALDLSGLTNVGGFTVRLVAPSVANFDADTAYQWPLATCGSLTGTFGTSLFTVDASAFAPETKGGFKVIQDGTTLLLEYNPSRGTLILLR